MVKKNIFDLLFDTKGYNYYERTTKHKYSKKTLQQNNCRNKKVERPNVGNEAKLTNLEGSSNKHV